VLTGLPRVMFLYTSKLEVTRINAALDVDKINVILNVNAKRYKPILDKLFDLSSFAWILY
jgi:hypothetical protein